MIHRIAIIGPESSGKSTMAKNLSEHFSDPYVEEFARDYLDHKKGNYESKDLDYIANEQLLLENKKVLQSKKFLFCDTTPLVVKVWSEFKYGKCSNSILETVSKAKYSLHLLLAPDLDYETDPLREHPNILEREKIFASYRHELASMNENYSIIKDKGEKRFKNALKAIQSEFSL